jgi:hypothetical protein
VSRIRLRTFRRIFRTWRSINPTTTAPR